MVAVEVFEGVVVEVVVVELVGVVVKFVEVVEGIVEGVVAEVVVVEFWVLLL